MYQKIVIELLFNLEITYPVINVYIAVKYKKKLPVSKFALVFL